MKPFTCLGFTCNDLLTRCYLVAYSSQITLTARFGLSNLKLWSRTTTLMAGGLPMIWWSWSPNWARIDWECWWLVPCLACARTRILLLLAGVHARCTTYTCWWRYESFNICLGASVRGHYACVFFSAEARISVIIQNALVMTPRFFIHSSVRSMCFAMFFRRISTWG